MPNKLVRSIKMAVFCAIGVYASISMFLSAANTFGKAPDFATKKPSDRCVSWFDTAETFAKQNNNTIVAYALNAGRYRWGFCTDLSNATLDAKFGASLLFDPLKDATDGKCSLTDPTLVVERETQCVINGAPAGTTCRDILATSPIPYGVAWKYRITAIGNSSAKPPPPLPPSGNQSTTTITAVTATSVTSAAPSTAVKKCAASYAKDDDMPPCPFSNVRFYGTENNAISVIFVLAALSSIALWIWEIINVFGYANEYGDNYGDLSLLSVPNDGTWGAIYTFFRVYASGEPMPGDDPELTWFQFFRSALNQVLAQIVGLIGIVGCNLREHLLAVLLFALTSLKLLYSLGLKAYTIAKPPAPTAQEIIDNAGEVPNPPSIDPNLNGVVADCVRRGVDKEYYKSIASSVDNSPSKNLYRKCLKKILTSGCGCIPAEISRLSVICRRETTDPAVYNECISWIQLYQQCENFLQGGPGTYAPPQFLDWRSKVAPELAAAHAKVAKGDGDDPLLASEKALASMITASPPVSNINMVAMQPQPQTMMMTMTQPQQQLQNAPSATFGDFQPVILNPQVPIAFASYAPASNPAGGTDVTQRIQQLAMQYQGQPITGGIHNVIGDPFPGQAKVLQIWYGGMGMGMGMQQQQQHQYAGGYSAPAGQLYLSGTELL